MRLIYISMVECYVIKSSIVYWTWPTPCILVASVNPIGNCFYTVAVFYTVLKAIVYSTSQATSAQLVQIQ